jgi:ABC-type Na+ efflux pump permease subunit
MKTATLISAVITVLFMLTAMICGLWIRANDITDSSSINFHIGAGIGAVIFCIITLILLVMLLSKIKKKV